MEPRESVAEAMVGIVRSVTLDEILNFATFEHETQGFTFDYQANRTNGRIYTRGRLRRLDALNVWS